MSAPQSLRDIPVGGRAVIRRVTCERAVAVRLMEMGLVPGTEVLVERHAPLGDPIELTLRAYSLSIRSSEAAALVVDAVAPSGAREAP